MAFEQFIEKVVKEIKSNMGDKKIIVQPIHKNNDIVYMGLIILDPILNISPTIYLDSYYHKYCNGMEMEDIIMDIIDTYEEHKPTEDFDISQVKNFDRAKSKVVMKLVNSEMNKEMLESVPHKPVGDLSIIYQIAVGDFINDYATVLINNSHMKYWGITENELHEIALINTPNLLPFRFESMENILEKADKTIWCDYIGLNMYVLTNWLKIHGATSMMYPNLLKRIYNFLEDNLIIIPSSMHEVIIMSEQSVKSECTIDELNRTVQSINQTELSDEEILSNHVYLYDGNELAIAE